MSSRWVGSQSFCQFGTLVICVSYRKVVISLNRKTLFWFGYPGKEFSQLITVIVKIYSL